MKDLSKAGLVAEKMVGYMSLPHIAANKLISFVELPAGLDPDDLIKAGD